MNFYHKKFSFTKLVIDIKWGNFIKLYENRIPIIVYYGARKLNDQERNFIVNIYL